MNGKFTLDIKAQNEISRLMNPVWMIEIARKLGVNSRDGNAIGPMERDNYFRQGLFI